MKQEGRFTETEFQKMRDQHLPYELRMLRAAAKELGGPEPELEDERGWHGRWMVVECFYIHLRTLHDFFYEQGAHEGDVKAIDFVDDSMKWRMKRPKDSPTMRRAVKLAGTMVAHLNYRRQANIESGRGLEWYKLARDMDRVYQAFQSAVDPNERIGLEAGFTVTPKVDTRSSASPDTIVTTVTTISHDGPFGLPVPPGMNKQ